MLSYALAIAIALSSLVLFSTAFVMSDIHRQDDFLWSGVGLVYALVLWFGARNITGAVLLGQAAASALLISYNWQTLKLRKAIANPEKATEIRNFSLLQAFNGLFTRDRSPKVPQAEISETLPKVTESSIAIPETTSTEQQQAKSTPKKSKTSRSVGKFWGKKSAEIPNTKLNQILDAEEPTSPERNTELTTKPKPESNQQLVTTPLKSEVKPHLVNQEKIISEPEAITEIVERQPATTAANSTEVIDNLTENTPQIEQQSETTDRIESNLKIEDNLEVEVIEVKTQTSALDDLETVEVAEILEANPEQRSYQRDQDSSNIIEVNTTEIEQTVEDKNPPTTPSI